MTLNKSRAFPFCPKNAEGNINPLLRSEEPKTPGMLYVHTKERIKTSHVCVGKAVKKKRKENKEKETRAVTSRRAACLGLFERVVLYGLERWPDRV